MSRLDPLAPAPWHVGNDVVDLADPRCVAKHEDVRFLRRVFAGEEREAIATAPEPAHALWLRWAAKESAYKVVSKARGAPFPFTHGAFVVESELGRDGVVRHEGVAIPFRVARSDGPLHVVALDPALARWPGDREGEGEPILVTGVESSPATRPGPPAPGWQAFLDEHFSERERRSVWGTPSARVRLAARSHLGRLLGVEERRLEIVCRAGGPGRSPPAVLLDGEPAPADVSLSHHGRWVGWALLLWGG